jgi:preprotein translocase subunit SecD
MATTSRKSARPVRTISLFALFIALLYVIMAATNTWVPKLGLDLRGGTTITLTARNTTGGGAVDPASLELARQIMSQRVDARGVGETEVVTSGDRQVVVSVPNVQEDELVNLVGQTAQLYFRRVFQEEAASGAEVVPEVEPADDGTVPEPEPTDDGTVPEPSVSASANPEPLPSASQSADGRPLPQLPSPVPSPRPTAPAEPLPDLDALLAYEPSERDTEDFANFKCDDFFPDVVDQPLIACDESKTVKYLLGPAVIRGDQVDEAAAGVPQNSVSWVVTLKFDAEGSSAFETVTGKLATESEPKNQFGIVLDGKVISAPRVQAAIPGGSAEISGSFTQASATQLASVLKYGALPLAFDVDSVDNVSAKLGGEQLQVGIIAGLIGLLLVVGYAILYYRGLFIVVVASLGIAGMLTYACMVILGQAIGFALNLPGIAGAIVAIGVTADSFIIFFERIRDEVREGRSLRTAIETGWTGSRKTILAADSVSMLSAVVLYNLAVGGVKGFAFTLGLTTLIDVAIVFWFTKPLMTVLGKTKFFGQGHRFSGFEAEHMGKRAPLHSSAPKTSPEASTESQSAPKASSPAPKGSEA